LLALEGKKFSSSSSEVAAAAAAAAAKSTFLFKFRFGGICKLMTF
jgi:hypothetical protein